MGRARSDGPRALIIGGSLAGLFAANLLRSVGWQVIVFERSAHDLSGRGAGLGATPELFAILHRLGAVIQEGLRVSIHSRVELSLDGGALAELPIQSTATAWDSLYGLLKRMLPQDCYRRNRKFESLRQNGNIIAVKFSDDTEAEGDLLIGAVGIRSSVRRYVTPSGPPSYAGYAALRGALAQTDIPSHWHGLLLEKMTFSFPPSHLGLTVPMASHTSPNGTERRCQISWFFPVDHGELIQLAPPVRSGMQGASSSSSRIPGKAVEQYPC